MLTDIFATRYEERAIWTGFGEPERRLLVQMSKLLTEQLYPYWTSEGKENTFSKSSLTAVHDKVAMELGLESLSPKVLVYNRMVNGVEVPTNHFWTMDMVIKNFLTFQFQDGLDPDIFMKRRLSVVELAFRHREAQVAEENRTLPQRVADADRPRPGSGIRLPGKASDWIKTQNAQINAALQSNVDELNARFQQAKFGMTYHNGFIQLAADQLASQQIEKPFWALVKNPDWANVDLDMKEAIDRRDTGGRDPGFYGARALESTIKIISDKKGWTHGGEKGAANYIDNLGKKANAFIEPWEADMLKAFFTNVRNSLGHGPGSAPMPAPSASQTDWAIEFCMSWIKSLITRL